MQSFNHIGLLGRLSSAKAQETTHRLIDFLQKQSVDVVISDEIAAMLQRHDVPYGDDDFIGTHSDLVIVVGGDGSMLGAARSMVDYQVPLLGVNRGRLGFLTDIMPSEIESKVMGVLEGDYISETRFMLEMSVWRDGELMSSGYALNDIVLHPGRHLRMIEFELYVDEEFVYCQASDGLIVTTPTGSTAYALSGGGPLMHPSLDAIGIVPLNAHSLTSRPIVVSGGSEIYLLLSDALVTIMQVACDGQIYQRVRPNDGVRIKKKATHLTLIHPSDHNYYETCRRKLDWSKHISHKRHKGKK
ncbi:NAD kinase [Candidatus Endobugula sertula]|uniref:NAD kinase n=1 Tax=Candidatus Endobugula sertula TaxID=62101 RepID=A0A1D2QQI8_9GAMM|nr:NAD kinase [Candidatus Endobugula sertula]